MSKRTKTRAANLPVPQTDAEAADTIKRIGDLNRAIGRIEHDMNDALAATKRQAEEQAQPLAEERDGLIEGLRVFCDANRARLTGAGKVKYHDFGAGVVEWRNRPPSVRLRAGTKAEEVIAWIKAQRTIVFSAFVRVKEELNKEAMLADAERAASVPGVTISSGGEDFAVTPFESDLKGAA